MYESESENDDDESEPSDDDDDDDDFLVVLPMVGSKCLPACSKADVHGREVGGVSCWRRAVIWRGKKKCACLCSAHGYLLYRGQGWRAGRGWKLGEEREGEEKSGTRARRRYKKPYQA